MLYKNIGITSDDCVHPQDLELVTQNAFYIQSCYVVKQ